MSSAKLVRHSEAERHVNENRWPSHGLVGTPVWWMPRHESLPQEVTGRVIMILRSERRAEQVAEQVIADQEGIDADHVAADERIALPRAELHHGGQRRASVIRALPPKVWIVTLDHADRRPQFAVVFDDHHARS